MKQYIIFAARNCRSSELKFAKRALIKLPGSKLVRSISREDLTLALINSQNGFTDIMKNEQFEKLNMSYNLAFDYLFAHQNELKSPIFIAHDHILVGTNDEVVRSFIPAEIRKARRELNCL